MSTPRWIPFAKGHGTENDFVILPDLHAELDLSVAQITALCDRRAGIGGDGVLRVVPAAKDPASVAQAGAAEWFMDYRNADGSQPEMCGNGARVFGQYLVAEGLAEPGILPIATRDGVKQLHVHSEFRGAVSDSPASDNPVSGDSESGIDTSTPTAGSVTVELALPRLGGGTTVIVNGTSLPATVVDVGNPHAVCLVETPLARFDFATAPTYDPAVFSEGVNIGLIAVSHAADSATAMPSPDSRPDVQIKLRVYERGSGETRSCGTAAVAAAAVALRAAWSSSAASPALPVGTVWVDLPGGRLRIEFTPTATLLTGPAVIVAKGLCLL